VTQNILIKKFSQDDESHVDGYNKNEYPLTRSILVQRLHRQQQQISSSRLTNSSLGISSSSLLKDTTIQFVHDSM
jgi:hypothetical protein